MPMQAFHSEFRLPAFAALIHKHLIISLLRKWHAFWCIKGRTHQKVTRDRYLPNFMKEKRDEKTVKVTGTVQEAEGEKVMTVDSFTVVTK